MIRVYCKKQDFVFLSSAQIRTSLTFALLTDWQIWPSGMSRIIGQVFAVENGTKKDHDGQLVVIQDCPACDACIARAHCFKGSRDKRGAVSAWSNHVTPTWTREEDHQKQLTEGGMAWLSLFELLFANFDFKTFIFSF